MSWFAQQTTSGTVVEFTVTPPGIVEEPDEWNRTTPARFAALMADLRALVGRPSPAGRSAGSIEYARVLEMQRRGLLHVHALLTNWHRTDLEKVRLLCIRHGFGPRFHVERVRSVGGFAAYIAARYLTKSHEDLGRRYRVVQYSRGWSRTPDQLDSELWGRALNAVDPSIVVPDGMSWSRWADREIDRGRGSYAVKPFSTGWPSRGSPITLFDQDDSVGVQASP
jgi:hypothetical protein